MDDTILETKGLTKEFRGFVAVNGVDLRIKRGEIHALIGPNGAGKTTCFNLLTKFLSPTSGTIKFNGIDITGERPAQIARRGVIRSFQISAVFPHLTVLENVRIGLQRKTGLSFHFWQSDKRLASLNEPARALLEQVDLGAFANETTVNLPYGRKRALEIATTLAMEPELMLLDEPTQGVDVGAKAAIYAAIERGAADGTAVIVSSSDAKELALLCDRVIVMRDGVIGVELTGSALTERRVVAEAYGLP